jgi:integrase
LIDLNAARDMARIAMDDADRGIAYAKRIAAEAAQRRMLAETGGRSPNRIDVIVDRYIDNHLKTLWSSWQNADRWLKKMVVPEWREREIASIRRADVVKLLDKVSDERTAAAAIEVRKHLSGLFNWAIATDQFDLILNPMVGLKRKEKYQPRENKLSREQLKQVWVAAGDIGYPFREMYRLLILTGQRRSEVAELQADWVFERPDGKKGVRVPASAYKTGKEHVYPLSGPAAAIVDSLPRRKAGPFLLSAVHTKSPAGKAPVSGFSHAKVRLDQAIAKRAENARKQGIELPPIPEFTVHDIRRSVATGMIEMGVSAEHVERVLGHELGGVAGIYNRHDYFSEKLAALQLWGLQFA